MKTLRLPLIAVLALFILSSACQRNGREDILSPSNTIEKKSTGAVADNASTAREPGIEAGTCIPNAYIITLESRTQVDGNWEWLWSVQNSNPGNGKNGTVQDLSHWGMQFGDCFDWSSVVSAAYSGDGITWTSFTPTYEPDPSQVCMIVPVLKFDFGTTGNAKSYYKLVVSQDYPSTLVPGFYKSGVNTGCCTFMFDGIGCSLVK